MRDHLPLSGDTRDCLCTVVMTPDVGTYIDHEWQPERPTTRIRLEVHSECPMHPYWYFGVMVRLVEDLGNGWAKFKWPDGKIWRHWRNQCTLGDGLP